MIHNQRAAAVSGEKALQKLMEGNSRYVQARCTHPNQTAARRAEVEKAQHPFAIIVGCSDSRVPPEIIFDQGLGDLFVVRLAGHVISDEAVGSIEYAVEHMGTRLIMVLGHAQCGAVTAAAGGSGVPGRIDRIIKAIMPALDRARNRPGDLIENAIKANIALAVEELHTSPLLKQLVKDDGLKIVGAYYHLDDGTVTIAAY